VKNPHEIKKVEGDKGEKQMSIWQFLMNNEKGAIF
jgi:hypothetical protein